MVYRSEVEALRARVAELEERLAQAANDAVRIRELERELERSRHDLLEAERAAAGLPPRKPTRVARAILLGLGVSCVVLLPLAPMLRPLMSGCAMLKPSRTIPDVPSDPAPCGSWVAPEECPAAVCNARDQEASGELECEECVTYVNFADAGVPLLDAEGQPVLGCIKRFPRGWKHVCDGNHGKGSTYELWCRLKE